MTQADLDHLGVRIGRNDVWLQWPDRYRPGCPVCTRATIGLVDRGRYIKGGLRIDTTAEPCGCELSAEQALAMQADAVAADALSAEPHDAADWRPRR